MVLLCGNCQSSACEPFFFSSILYSVSLVSVLSFLPILARHGCAKFDAISCQSARLPRCSLWFDCRAAIILENLVIKGCGGSSVALINLNASDLLKVTIRGVSFDCNGW